jgi:hypothetical protein
MLVRYWKVLALAGAAAVLGCDSSKTETGYTPRRLGMSSGEMRALYAPAYSPEAKAAEGDKKPESQVRKPQY